MLCCPEPARYFGVVGKRIPMANKSNEQRSDKQRDNRQHAQHDSSRKGDTSRSSDQGRKEASGGRTDTNNRGQVKGGSERL